MVNPKFTKKILAALRSSGLTARSGFGPQNIPAEQNPQAVVLPGKGAELYIRVQIFSVLGYGCINHENYSKTGLALSAKVETSLKNLGVVYRSSPVSGGARDFYVIKE